MDEGTLVIEAAAKMREWYKRSLECVCVFVERHTNVLSYFADRQHASSLR